MKFCILSCVSNNITVSSPHRKAAFEACQYAIDTLKEAVPIWKKEFFEDANRPIWEFL